MPNTSSVKYEQVIPELMTSMDAVHQVLIGEGLDRNIQHLVQLRASQMNQCGFCVKMHTKEAREDGETSDRLDRVVVWDQMSDFSGPEQAALEWTEALTELNPKNDLGQIRARLREHFTEKEIGVLTTTIAMINLWNRINISRH